MPSGEKIDYYRRPDVARTYRGVRYGGGSGNHVLHKELDRILPYLPPAGRILDLAAGTGRSAPWLNGPERAVFAADSSNAMLSLAADYDRRRVLADARCLPFRDESFDAVVCFRLLFHYPTPMDIIKEASRVCRTGGVIVFETYRWSLLIRDWYIPRWLGGRVHVHSDRFIRARLDELGFEIVALSSAFLFAPTAYRLLPRFALPVLDYLEHFLPERLRVSALWIARKLSKP